MILLNKLNGSHGAQFYTLLLCVALVVQIILSVLLSQYTSTTAYWLVNIVYMACLLACGYLYCNRCHIDIVGSLHISTKPKLLDSIWLCVIIFLLVNGMTPINDWFVSIIGSCGGSAGGVDSSYVYDNILLAILVLCLVAPVVEELLFRGIIGSGLLSNNKEYLAVLLGGAIFALFHMNMAQLLHQFITGCILMIFLSRTGSIWVAIVGHIFNNGIVVLLDYYVYSSGWYSTNAIWVSIVGLASAGILLALYVWHTNSRCTTSAEATSMSVADKTLLAVSLAVSALILILGAI